MAKATSNPVAVVQPVATDVGLSVHNLAVELFRQSWKPRGSICAWMIAVECYRGAEEFLRVAERVADGLSADDVIAEQQLADELQAESIAPIQNTGG